ncbi:MAG: NAD-binding protein, partial [Deltaproteobacteria bacterium]|nr:NAD-binding protein [Deltaproteobacteria bacterium]
YFFCASDQFNALQKFLGISRRATRRVIINGGGHIGHALAKRLEKRRLDVRILEISEWRCQQLSQWLDKSLILNADGNDPMALKSEGVEHADFFINVTSSDDVNLVSSTLAKGMGVPRTVTLVKQPELIPMISQRKISDVAFSPRQLTARKILRFVRGQQLDSFFTFANSDIELLELKVNPGLPCLDTPMASLALPEGVLIGAVRREGRIFIPRGHDSLQAGDRILLIQQRRNRRLTKALFLEAPGGAQVVPDAAASRNG